MHYCRKLYSRLDTTKHDGEVESFEEYRSRWRSLRIIYLVIFLKSFGLAILDISVDRYLFEITHKNKHPLKNWILITYFGSSIIWNLILGWWNNKLKSIRWPMQISLAVFIISNILLTWLVISKSAELIAIQFPISVCLSNLVLCRSYLSAATRLSERNHAYAMITVTHLLGALLGRHTYTWITERSSHPEYFSGSINIILSLIMMLLLLPCIFKEHEISAKELMLAQGDNSEEETYRNNKPNYYSALILLAVIFVVNSDAYPISSLAEWRTRYTLKWKIGKHHVISFMDISQISSIITYLLIAPLSRYFGDRNVLIWGGFSMMIFGQFLYECYRSNIQRVLLLTVAFECVGFPISMLIRSTFSKVLGPRPQGIWQALLLTVDILAVLLGITLYDYVEPRLGDIDWIIGYTTFALITAMIVVICVKKLFVAPIIGKKPYTLEEQLGI